MFGSLHQNTLPLYHNESNQKRVRGQQRAFLAYRENYHANQARW
jgi:hypothetical protein